MNNGKYSILFKSKQELDLGLNPYKTAIVAVR